MKKDSVKVTAKVLKDTSKQVDALRERQDNLRRKNRVLLLLLLATVALFYLLAVLKQL